MFDKSVFENLTNEEKLEAMCLSLSGIVGGDDYDITKLSNASALINSFVDNVSWCGFYVLIEDELILGPFQGNPACTKLKLNKGVCAKAATTKETVVVENVDEFEGHVACDSASKSEIVIPIFYNGEVVAVLDLDSDKYSNFGYLEKQYLEKACKILEKEINWNKVKKLFI